MKYINQLNIVLAILGGAFVAYTLTTTFWAVESPEPLEITRIPAPEAQPVSPRPFSLPPRPEAALEGASGEPSGGGLETGSGATFQQPPERPAEGRRVPATPSRGTAIPVAPPRTQEGEIDESPPPTGPPRRSGPIRPLNPASSGRNPLFGPAQRPPEVPKREAADDPSPPPVRSSIPEQRPPR